MDISDIKNIVQTKYNVHVKEIEKIKNIYKIYSKDNIYSLKVIKYEFKHFIFIYEAMKHLQDRGFESIPLFIKTVQGEEYIKIGENYAYLNPWIIGRECNYDNPIDIEIATRKLGELHQKSEGFVVKRYMEPRNYWYKWINTFSTRNSEIADFSKRIEIKEKKTEFDCIYYDMISEEFNRGEKSITNLKTSNYQQIMKEHKGNRGFCHHDYAHHNLLISDKNTVNIIDFDYCILDSYLHDLGSLMIRKMKNGKWSLENANNILNIYRNYNSVNKDEIEILSAFIEYPQEFWQIGIQYYWEMQTWDEEFFVKKLIKIKEDRKDREDFVQNLREV